MKTKKLLSLLTLFIFALLGGGSVDGDALAITLGVCILVSAIAVAVNDNAKREEEEQKRLKKEQKQKEEEEKANKYQEDKQKLIEEFGEPDKTIIIEAHDIEKEINVFEKRQTLIVMGRRLKFEDIISCTFTDSPRIIKGKLTSVTKSSTGSTIGRAIVGDVIAGPAGAIIGGTTGKKSTTYHQGADTTIHDYTVIINVNDLSNPIIRINTKYDGNLTNEIVGLMNVIIMRK